MSNLRPSGRGQVAPDRGHAIPSGIAWRLFRLPAAVALLGLAISPPLALAAETDAAPLSEEVFIGELPVVLTATRLAQPRSETPAAVTVIDREMIRASGARQIAELFRLVPGFQVGYANGNQPIVTYHGLSDQYSRRMQVLVDGRSIYSPLFGGVSWYELPVALEDIERIEVIRGPNAASYGANSVVGVINIITRHPSQDAGSFGKLSIGNHNILDGAARQNWSSASHNTRISLGYRADDGFDSRPDSSRVPFFNLRSDIHLTTTDSLELQLGSSLARNDEGFFDSVANVARETKAVTHFQVLRWSQRSGPDRELSVQFYHNYRKIDDDYLTKPRSVVPFGTLQAPVTLDALEDRYDLELQHTLRPQADWRVVWGIGTRLDRVRSETRFSTPETLQNRLQRLFGNSEWRVTDQTIINAGAMVERTDLTDTEVSPRLALNHHLTLDHTVRIAASRGSRTPVIFEDKGDEKFFFNGVLLEQDFRATAGLKPETIDSTEVGYIGRLLSGRVRLDLRVYRDRIRDVITSFVVPAADLDGQAFSLRNEGEATVTGVDSEINWRPNESTRLALNYAHMSTKAHSFTEEETITRIASVPRHSLGALAIRRLTDEWYASTAYYRIASMTWRGSGDAIDRYGRLDLRLARGLRFSGARGELAATVQNALNDRFVDFRNENLADRCFYISLNMEFR